jgi:hypothetical protein
MMTEPARLVYFMEQVVKLVWDVAYLSQSDREWHLKGFYQTKDLSYLFLCTYRLRAIILHVCFLHEMAYALEEISIIFSV